MGLCECRLLYGVLVLCLMRVGSLGAEPSPPVGQTQKDAQESVLSWTTASVRALGKSKDKSAVQVLRSTFFDHFGTTNKSTDVFLDAEVLLAFREINREEAEAALRDTLHDIKRRGPQNAQEPWRDERYMAAMSTGIRLLGATTNDLDGVALTEMYSDPKLDGSLRSDAFYWSLIKEIRRHGVDQLPARIDWAYRRYMAEGGKGIPAYKSVAIERMVYDMGPSVRHLIREQTVEVEKTEGKTYWGALWLKHLADNLATKSTNAVTEVPYWRVDADKTAAPPSRPTGKRPGTN